jgi:hypothetical protein
MRLMRRRARIPQWLWWVVIAAVVGAVLAASLLLARASDENLSEAVGLATGLLGLVIGGVPVVVALRRRPTGDEASVADAIAKLQFRRIGNEIDRLGLSGEDYIDLEWSRGDSGAAEFGTHWLATRPRLAVILGDKGSGKSVATMLLTHQLLRLRRDDHKDEQRIPVPVLLQVGEWDPGAELLTWVAAKLTDQLGVADASAAESLVQDGALLLVLDGFDDIPKVHRTKALKAIRRFLTDTHCSVVLASRITEYEGAMKRAGRFPPPSEIRIGRVRPAQAKRFLLNGTQEVGHWDPIIDLVDEHDNPVAEALESPLMVYLTSEVYKHEPPDRSELEELKDRAAVERHLLAAYLPARYDRGTRYDRDRAVRWLRTIAGHLVATDAPRFAWWELHKALNPRDYTMMTAIISGLFCWPPLYFAFGPVLPLGFITAFAALIGWVVGWIGGQLRQDTDRQQEGPQYLAFHRKQFRSRVARRFVYPWLVAMLIALPVFWFMTGSVALVLATLTYMTLTALAGLVNEARLPHQLQIFGPRRVFETTRNATLATALLYMIAIGLMVWAIFAFLFPYEHSARAGVAFGLMSVTVSTLLAPATWHQYRMAHLKIALTKPSRLPLRLMRFLDDAHKRGVLRQVGATYEFRHDELKAYLIASAGESGARAPS